MRNIMIVGILLLTTAGCQHVLGPFQPRPPMRVDDPTVHIKEQERRGRAWLPLPDESPKVGPMAGTPHPGVWGARTH